MKRIISFALCLSMLFSMLPVNVFAADMDETVSETEPTAVQETAAPAEEASEVPVQPGEETLASIEAAEPAAGETAIPQATTEETVPVETDAEEITFQLTWTYDGELPSDEELFAAYAEATLYGTGISLLGTAAGETLGSDLKAVYDALVPVLKAIASGELDSSVVTLSGLPGTSFNQDDLDTLLQVILADLPYELYWFDKTKGVSATGGYSSSSGLTLKLSFRVSANYSATGKAGTYDVDTSLTGAAVTAAANAKDIAAKYAGVSDYEKLVGYKTEICGLTSYNSSAANSSTTAYGNPWQLIWVFDGDSSTNVVCEGYSKAFQYLCDLSDFDADITCYNVVGTLSGGAHMWNIVSINGRSYMADVTNSDSGTVGSSGGLFLVGGTANSDGSYTFKGYKFAYGDDAKALWGTDEGSILILDTDDFDPDSLVSSTPETDTDSDTVSGTCGENVTWTLVDDTTLTISGQGAMTDYDSKSAASWAEYLPSITTVVIEEGVTSVGAYAFYYYDHLTSVTIPDSVTAIGEGAFAFCEKLSAITIPGSVTDIGGYAFRGCTDLARVSIGSGAAAIGDYAFAECDGLTYIIIPGTAATIGEGAFASCTNLTYVTLGSGVTSIGTSAFAGCQSIASIELPNSITAIGSEAFSGCSGITAVTFLCDVTQEIAQAFAPDCCPKLTSITLGSGATAIGSSTFESFDSIISVYILDTVTSIGDYAFASCPNLLSVFIGSGVTGIGGSAFYGCEGLVSLDIPGNVTEIGEAAFALCTNLTDVTIESGVTAIGPSAFFGCSNLSCITSPDSVASIGEEAFSNCASPAEFFFLGSAPVFGDGVFCDVTATAYYPATNGTWTTDVLQDYGGDITWVPRFDTISGNVIWDQDLSVGVPVTIEKDGRLVIPEGVTVTLYQPMEVLGTLVVNGTLQTYHPNGMLTIRGGTVTVNGTLYNGNMTTIYSGSLILNGNLLGYAPVHVGGTISGDALARNQQALEDMLAEAAVNGYPAVLTTPVILASDLTIDSALTITMGGQLLVPEGITLTNNGSISCDSSSSLVVSGTYVHGKNAQVSCEYYEDAVNTITGVPNYCVTLTCSLTWTDSTEREALVSGLMALVKNAYAGGCVRINQELTLTGDMTIPAGVTVEILSEMTVPEGCTLTNSGVIRIGEGGTLTVEGKFAGSLPELTDASAKFLCTDPAASLDQDILEAQLAAGGTVPLCLPLTLSKDLVVPAGSTLLVSGSITIPSERSLINNGRIQLAENGSITAVNGGELRNNGQVCITGGTLDMTYGEYAASGDAAVLLVYENELPFDSDGDIGVYGIETAEIGILVQGGNEDIFHDIVSFHDSLYDHSLSAHKSVQFLVTGEVTLSRDLTIPDYITLTIGEQAVLTVPGGVCLDNCGSIHIGSSGTLVIEEGGSLSGNRPNLDGDSAGYVNESVFTQADLEELLTVAAEYGTVVLSVPLTLERDLEIPETVTLKITGKDNFLTIPEGVRLSNSGTIECERYGGLMADGGTLVNSGRIYAQKDGIVDMTAGSYTVSGAARLYCWHSCDAEGVVTGGTVEGIEARYLTVTAETYADEAVIREMINATSEIGWELAGFQIRFMGEAALTGDLTLPAYADPVIPNNNTLTVPEGVTLTDASGMIVYGTLINEGYVLVTDFPICAVSRSAIAYPENCSNYYVSGEEMTDYTINCSTAIPLVGENGGARVWVESYTPEYAEYYGYFELEIVGGEAMDSAWVNGRTVYSSAAGTVEVAVKPIVGYDYENNYENLYPETIKTITLNFAEQMVHMYSDDAMGPDFYEGLFFGLYSGSTIKFYANLTGNESETDPSLDWVLSDGAEEFVSYYEKNGALYITASDSLTTLESIRVTAKTADDSAKPLTTILYLRPKADSVGITLNGETVSGQTVLFDLKRDGSSVKLEPAADPVGACNISGFASDGSTPLVKWTSSSKIATVDENGNVSFTGQTGKVTITMTAVFGSKKTAKVTFNVVSLAQSIASSESNASVLIGGSSASYTVCQVTDGQMGAALKSSAVTWYLCDKNGQAIASHPYAAVTAAGKLTTKTVADETKVYLMAQVSGDENSARLSEPVLVTLYPAITDLLVRDPLGNTLNGTTARCGSTAGDTFQLSYKVLPYRESVKSAVWKSSKTGVAVIDQNGLITVKGAGTSKFTLTVTDLSGKKTTVTFQMTFGTFTKDLNLFAKMPDGTAGDLDALMIHSGESITFTAANMPTNVTTSGVTWALNSKTYATLSKGVLKAKTVTNPQVVTVTVTSKDGACSRQISVTILPKTVAVNGTKLEALVIRKADGTYLTKTTQTISGSLQVFANSDSVSWKSSKPAVAAIDGSGLIEAKASGTTAITATAADGRTAAFTLKVGKVSTGVTVGTKSAVGLQVASGKSLALTGTVTYSNGSSDSKVSWSVDNTALASISSSGKLTAAKGLTQAATVTVTAAAKDGASDPASVQVRILPVTTGMEIYGSFGTRYPADVSNTVQKWDMLSGTEFSLSANIFPADAMDSVTWGSSNSKIARIDQNGNVTCVGSGTVTITAAARDGSGKKASFKLTVYKTMDADSLKLPETAFIAGGKSLTMTKLAGYSIDTLATNKTLTWTMTDADGGAVSKSVATLSKGVLKTKAVKQAVDLRIRAAATDGSGEWAECIVTIYPATKSIAIYNSQSAAITGKTVSVPVNQAYQILPKATNSGTAADYLAPETAWTITSAKPALAEAVFEDGCVYVRAVEGAKVSVNTTVKFTVKAKDGSGKYATFTVKFTAAVVEEQEPLFIGFVLYGSDTVQSDDYVNTFSSGAFSNSTLDILISTDFDAQVDKLYKLIQQGVDYLVLSPIQSTGWEDVLTEAKNAGIPVIIAGDPIDADASLYDAYVGNDLEAQGTLAGQWLAEYLNGAEANILVIEGTSGAAATTGRSAGFKEVADEHSEWTILDSQCGNFTENGGHEVMSSFCKSYEAYEGDYNVVICQNEDMANGARTAMEEYGVDCYGADSEVKIITYGASSEGLQDTLDGNIHCNVESNCLYAQYVHEIIELMEAEKEWPTYTLVEDNAYVAPGIESEYALTVTQDIVDSRAY